MVAWLSMEWEFRVAEYILERAAGSIYPCLTEMGGLELATPRPGGTPC